MEVLVNVNRALLQELENAAYKNAANILSALGDSFVKMVRKQDWEAETRGERRSKRREAREDTTEKNKKTLSKFYSTLFRLFFPLLSYVNRRTF